MSIVLNWNGQDLPENVREQMPAELRKRIYAWLDANASDERKKGDSDEQFFYKTRKKALGPFKRRLWDLETKDEILAAQRRKISYLFTELRVNDTRPMADRYVHPVEVHRPIPEGLRAAVTAR